LSALGGYANLLVNNIKVFLVVTNFVDVSDEFIMLHCRLVRWFLFSYLFVAVVSWLFLIAFSWLYQFVGKDQLKFFRYSD